MDFAVPADHRIKLKESEKKDKYLDLAKELKKTMEHEGDDYTSRDWCIRYKYLRTIKGTEGLESWRTRGDGPNYSIVENGQNTERSPGDLRRLAVTYSIERPSPNIDVKNSEGVNNNNNNTEESPGDLRRLAVTQTPVKNYQLTLMWKTLKE